jgi:mannose-6-phosphate isomerase-like protein (cupin superfamily)
LPPQRASPHRSRFWSPRVIAEVDDAYIKVAKVHGSLAWHSHENEDELFYILGKVGCESKWRSGRSNSARAELFVVPKGVRHNPLALDECHVMLIEPSRPCIRATRSRKRHARSPISCVLSDKQFATSIAKSA